MVDRVKTAECSMDKIVRSIEKNKEDFHKKSYYKAFEKFKNILIQIRDFTKSVSKLKGYKKFLNATDVKNKYDHLTKEFDKCMEELHFAIDVSNAMDRELEAERVDKALEEVEQMLANLGDKVDTIAEDVGFIKAQITKQVDVHAKKIDPNELVDPLVQTTKGSVIKKIYKSAIEVACKPIKGQNENELAILGKLGQSPRILYFYGQSYINNNNVMVSEWAERGNLRELYDKFDIPWTRKIQIAKDIFQGITFLRTVNIFHHDIRCENIFVLRDLNVKIGNFKCAREVNGVSTNLSSLVTNIIRWMAPELIEKYKRDPSKHKNEKYIKISDHVLTGERENIFEGKFKTFDEQQIQLEFIKIIGEAWRHQPELRITVPTLSLKLEELSRKYQIPPDAPLLLKDKELDLDGQKKSLLPKFDDDPEEIIEEDDIIIPLEVGTEMHKKKNYQEAWNCFKQNAELGNPAAKFWLGYYLHYGYHVEKDPIQARKLFKEAADDHNHSESQCRYAVSLLGDLNKESNEDIKDKNRKEIIRYFELAAENSSKPNVDAMYYLGDIYVNGKLKVHKNKERGVNYLRLASNSNHERASVLLKKLSG
ncbi:13162_t:CDS:2 [Gigaspora margarita]|uniref:13162_t:CDS:1 n=1 Tax=Gigaspora margarita TaxID=4874 RepID=A0ABN7UI23_GIGMA|nr:13162_t:CDS:2 [Gigaspora margarita]